MRDAFPLSIRRKYQVPSDRSSLSNYNNNNKNNNLFALAHFSQLKQVVPMTPFRQEHIVACDRSHRFSINDLTTITSVNP
jgi:hypothetical protein